MDSLVNNMVVVSQSDFCDKPVSQFEVLFSSSYVTNNGVHRLALKAANSVDKWLKIQYQRPVLHVLLPPEEGDDYDGAFPSKVESKDSLRCRLLSEVVKKLPKTIPVQLPVNIFKGKSYAKAKDFLYLGRVRYEVLYKKLAEQVLFAGKVATVMKERVDQLGVQVYLEAVDKVCLSPAKKILESLGEYVSVTKLNEFHSKIAKVLTYLAIIDVELLKTSAI